MQIQRIGFGVKGFYRIADYALRWAHMITPKAEHKAQVLKFWEFCRSLDPRCAQC